MGGGRLSGHVDDDELVTTRSSSSEPELVKVDIQRRDNNGESTSSAVSAAPTLLVYAKSKVYLHPSSYSRDNVAGWISIVKRGKRDYLLSWIPESLVREEDRERFVRVEIGEGGEVAMREVPVPSSPALSSSYSNHAWSVPLSSLYSIQVTPPTLANWYGKLEVHLSESFLQSCSNEEGQIRNLPGLPLFFHDDESPSTMLMMDRRSQAMHSASSNKLPSSWGGEDLLSTLKKYANVVKSTIQPQLYLVNPSQSDLEAHSVPLYEDELLSNSGANAVLAYRNRSATSGSTSNDPSSRTSILHQSLSPHASTSNSDALPTLDNLTFNVLSSFSRLTNRARSTAQNIAHPILSHPLSKPILKHLPPPIASLANANSPEYSKWAEKAGVAGYDAARVYLARWARTVAEEGERARRAEMRFQGGEGVDGQPEADEVGGPFEVLATTYRVPRPRSTRVQGVQPIIESEWKAWFDPSTGKLMLSGEEAKRRIFQRGLVEGARREAWPFLLSVYPWDSTRQQREDLYSRKKLEYEGLKSRWFGKKEVTSTELFIEEHHRIQIDCLRTDRNQPMFSSNASAPISGDRNLADLQNAQMAASTINAKLRGGDSGGQPPGNYHTHKLVEILLTYNVWETELGYVQGMSDLCSPLYVVLEGDETLVFWCFVNLMEERMKPNFYRDQSGMKHQLSVLQELILLMDPQLYRHLERTDSLNLFFCFRWLLISFKREFKFEDCLSVWEGLWSAPSKSFHLFLAMSILEMNRGIIIRYLQEFDEVLKYINELAQTLDPQPLLSQAEVLYLGFRNLVEATDRRRAERATSTANANSAEGLRQRKSEVSKDKGKEGDPLVKLVNDEVDAEAKVPDIEINQDLRNLLG